MNKIFGSTLGIGITASLVVVVGAFLLKNSGLHFQELKIVRGGDIAIEASGINASVFIDQKKIFSEENEADELILIDNISPGTHSVLVFNEDRWPWRKDIVVRSGETTFIKPFLLKKNPSGLIVTNKDAEYPSIFNDITKSSLPTKDNPTISKSGLVKIWAEENSVFALWSGEESTAPDYFCDDKKVCSKEILVLKADEKIRGVDFLGAKDDILLVALSNGVFALEIDRRGGTQNFQPIYKGTELPKFKKYEDSTVYVLDGTAIFIIDL